MIRFFLKHPRLVLVIAAFLSLIIALAALELFLKIFFPYEIATIGHVNSKNALTYGWGYNPNEPIRIRNPDTGEMYVTPANNHGWRDKDRDYDNKKNAYRILVLGDSVTFGAVVPADKVYTRLLEEKLNAAGYNAEVINIAYGGWGTDQELEAFEREGIQYQPNLIIIQFCQNDLAGNATGYQTSKGGNPVLSGEGKPFYYLLGKNNELIKKTNPDFLREFVRTWKDRMKVLISKSEILKRLYAVYLNRKFRDDFIPEAQPKKYRIGKTQLEQLQAVLNLANDSPLYLALKGKMDSKLDAEELSSLAKGFGHRKDEETILRIFEDRWFQQYWSKEKYLPKTQNPDSIEWRLYFALMRKIKDTAKNNHAKLAIFPADEIGQLNWNLYWYHVRNDETSKRNFLQYREVLKNFAAQNGIGFIANTIPYQRARHDPHQNIEGNRAMAEDIWKYLFAYHKLELEQSKNR